MSRSRYSTLNPIASTKTQTTSQDDLPLPATPTETNIHFHIKGCPLLPPDLILLSSAEKLGEGGTGTVYKGTYRVSHSESPTDVAIKIYTVKTNTNREFIKKALVSEASILSKLHSPYIVTCLGIMISSDRLGIVTELMQGGTLGEALRSDTFTLSTTQKLTIALEILLALKRVFEKGYIYGDMKSDNILLTKDFHAKLSDFDQTKLANKKEFSGSMIYVPPEFLLKPQQSADIFSYGILLIELMLDDVSHFDNIYHSYPDNKDGLLDYFTHLNDGTLQSQFKNLIDKLNDISIINLCKKCIEWKREARPSIDEVETTLRGILNAYSMSSQPTLASSTAVMFSALQIASSTNEMKEPTVNAPMQASHQSHHTLELFSSFDRGVSLHTDLEKAPSPALTPKGL